MTARPDRQYDDADPQPGMRISHERPAADTEPHIIAPLIVVLADGQRLTARQWSLRGIRDRVLDGHALTGARLEIPFQGFQIGFPVELLPSADGSLWVFEGLTGRQREALGVFYRNLLTGRMAATEEVITALDTPVDLVPMGETAEEKAAGMAKAKPRRLRAMLSVTWYVGLFCTVMGLLGTIGWNTIEGVELMHTRVVAERLELRAPREGYVFQQTPLNHMQPNAAVLARVEAPEGNETLADVERRHVALQQRVAEARARLGAHDRARADVRAMVANLHSPAALRRFDAGVSLRPGDFNDIRGQLESQLRLHETDLERTGIDLRRLRQLQQYMHMTAPVPGFVAFWHVRDGQFVRPADPVAIFETDTPRLVRGWADDRVGTMLRAGMRAGIVITSAGVERRLEGRVTLIEAGVDPTAPERFGLGLNGMMVTIAVDGLDAAAARDVLPFNSPAQVIVYRGLLQRLFGGA